jgi:hypothetical protein
MRVAEILVQITVVSKKLGRHELKDDQLAASRGQVARIQIGQDVIEGYRASDPDAATMAEKFSALLAAAASKHGYGTGIANKNEINIPMVLLILMALLSFGALVFTASDIAGRNVSDQDSVYNNLNSLSSGVGGFRRISACNCFRNRGRDWEHLFGPLVSGRGGRDVHAGTGPLRERNKRPNLRAEPTVSCARPPYASPGSSSCLPISLYALSFMTASHFRNMHAGRRACLLSSVVVTLRAVEKTLHSRDRMTGPMSS